MPGVHRYCIDTAPEKEDESRNHIVSASVEKYRKLEGIDYKIYPVDLDTDTASETEDAFCKDKNDIDVDPTVPHPDKISLPISPHKMQKRDQGVQVDVEYTMKHEVGWLREQNKVLRQENKALKEAVDKGEVDTPEIPKKATCENEFSWAKKLKFFTGLTLQQCSALYDNLDTKGREVLLSVVS